MYFKTPKGNLRWVFAYIGLNGQFSQLHQCFCTFSQIKFGNEINKCPQCDGKGTIEEAKNCVNHNLLSPHYYCISNSHHGDNMNQYHK